MAVANVCWWLGIRSYLIFSPYYGVPAFKTPRAKHLLAKRVPLLATLSALQRRSTTQSDSA